MALIKPLLRCATAVLLTIVQPSPAQTTRPTTQPANLSGTWIWIQSGTFGTTGRTTQRNPSPPGLRPNSRVVTLQLVQEGEKLSGQIENYGPAIKPIEEASFKDGQVTFQVIQTLNPQTAQRIGRPVREVLATYKGQFDGEVIRGRTWRGPEGTGPGESWIATRPPPEQATP